ncbi:thiopeptide-type bacteriocin biosynthesis protein [Flavobacterium sp.]|uniref:thiopeptide-type bacteriocin biosynthesis protein n=1 Tax=Flavobacterium sp. TaxID=239 RepID=UPI0040484DDF
MSEVKSKYKLNKYLLNKIVENDGEILNFLDSDLVVQKELKTKLPPTFSVIFELLNCKTTNEQFVYFKFLGGISAINLVSRFSHVTNNLCQEIVEFEKSILKDKLICEIDNHANIRRKNIISTKKHYDYSIPINTVGGEVSKNVVPLSDLYIKFSGHKFILASKNLKKELIPRITSAINFSHSDSELYKFLADLQSQSFEFHYVNFDLNRYDLFIPYVPRIILDNNIILYPSQLLLTNNDYKLKEFKEYLLNKVEQYSFSSNISYDADKGEIIINLENDSHIKELFDFISKKGHLYIKECLYDYFNPVVNNSKGHYSHEFIASVKNSESLIYQSEIIDSDVFDVKSDNIPFISDWLYIEVYSNPYGDNEILDRIYKKLLIKNEIELFFYVKYGYGDRHIRLRFKTKSEISRKYIIETINNLKSEGLIRKYMILPYEKEISRYGGINLLNITENIFSLDSQDTLMNIVNHSFLDKDRFQFSILKLEVYFSFFQLDLDNMILFCEKMINHFQSSLILTQIQGKNLIKNLVR